MTIISKSCREYVEGVETDSIGVQPLLELQRRQEGLNRHQVESVLESTPRGHRVPRSRGIKDGNLNKLLLLPKGSRAPQT